MEDDRIYNEVQTAAELAEAIAGTAVQTAAEQEDTVRDGMAGTEQLSEETTGEEQRPGRAAKLRESILNTASDLREKLDDAGARLRGKTSEEQSAAKRESGEDGIGVIRIADDVVAMIASYAAREIDGVTDMAGTAPGEWLGRVGYKNPLRGVKVEVEDGRVRTDISIVMGYGYNIPATSSKVQSRVKQAIENMTGLTVTDVNVRIAGITVPGGSTEPSEK